MAGWQSRPVDAAASHAVGVPGEGIHLDAVVAHPPLDPALCSGTGSTASPVLNTNRRTPAISNLRMAGVTMPPVSSKILWRNHSWLSFGADPLPAVGYAQDDGAAPFGVGEAGHLLSQVGSSHFVLALSRLDGSGPATSSGFLLDVPRGSPLHRGGASPAG